MFKLVHKNRKGVTLVELLVCVAILGLVVPVAGQLLYSLTNFFGVSEDRWHVQTAVKMACTQFESNKDGLTNAYQVDILYDPVIEEGVYLDDSGRITWKNNSSRNFVTNDEGVGSIDDPFTYIFSTPSWDKETDQYLGRLLYMRDYGSQYSRLLLEDYGLGYIPVEATFSMGTTEPIQKTDTKYTSSEIFINFASGKEDMPPYEFTAGFTIVNLARPINQTTDPRDGELKIVYEKEWLNVVNKTPLVYPAGWSHHELNVDASGKWVSDRGFPEATVSGEEISYSAVCQEMVQKNGTMVKEVTDVAIKEKCDIEVKNKTTGAIETVEDAPVIARQANILRYKSPAAEKTQGTPAERTTGSHIATCLTGWAMAGSDLSNKVLGNLRMFRDNVLAGTKLGDWVIHEYYYTWSPFLVEKTAFLKPVYKAILIPMSYVCGFISSIK